MNLSALMESEFSDPHPFNRHYAVANTLSNQSAIEFFNNRNRISLCLSVLFIDVSRLCFWDLPFPEGADLNPQAYRFANDPGGVRTRVV